MVFLIYESLSNIVSFRPEKHIYGCSWEKFAEKYSPPFGAENIYSINFEPTKNLYSIVREDGTSPSFPEQSLEINWIKANWNNFCESFHELETPDILSVSIKKVDLLLDTDWMVQRHQEQILLGIVPSITTQQFQDLLAYRQTLRDIPSSEAPENTITWPSLPI
jgi:hypothetical protein